LRTVVDTGRFWAAAAGTVLEALEELAPTVVEVADGVESGVRLADGTLVGPATANGEGEDDGGLAFAWGWLWLTQPEDAADTTVSPTTRTAVRAIRAMAPEHHLEHRRTYRC